MATTAEEPVPPIEPEAEPPIAEEPVKNDDPASKPKKDVTTKKVPTPRKRSPPTHPPYYEMIEQAIETLKDRTGSSQYAITKFIEENHKNLPPNFKKLLLVQLKKFVAAGKLSKVKNSYKLPPVRAPRSAPLSPVKRSATSAAKPKSKPKATATKDKKASISKSIAKPKAAAAKSKAITTAAKPKPAAKAKPATKAKPSANSKVPSREKLKAAPKRKAPEKPKADKKPPQKAARTSARLTPGKMGTSAAQSKKATAATVKKSLAKSVKAKAVKSPAKKAAPKKGKK